MSADILSSGQPASLIDSERAKCGPQAVKRPAATGVFDLLRFYLMSFTFSLVSFTFIRYKLSDLT